MLDQFFGHYLLNKGILTQNQFCEILQKEQQVKVKLGILAVNAGLMTIAQVENVYHLQWMKDKKFGALAIEQGYLTSEQVDWLLASQQEGHLTLMQAIVDQGYMTLTEVDAALADFRKEYGIKSNLQDIDYHRQVIKQVVDFAAASDKADLLYDYVGLLLRNIVRFLNDMPFVVGQVARCEQAPQWHVWQQIVGDMALSTGLLMEEAVLLEIASRFYGKRLDVVDEMALDSVREFLNVHNGVFVSSLSGVGLMTDLQPPVTRRAEDTSYSGTDYRVTVGTAFGQFELLLSLRDES